MKQTILHLLSLSNHERKVIIEQKGSAFVEEMMEHIGTTDETIRNDYIQLFLELLSTNFISDERKKDFINQLTNNRGLFYHIGENSSDSVFRRAYSAFMLSNLLKEDIVHPFLSSAHSKCVIEKCVTYLSKEKDVRGYIQGKGWANAIYFGASLSKVLIQHPSFDAKFSPLLLQGIKNCFWKGQVFVHDEEEMLVKIVESLIRYNIQEDLLIEWVEQIFDQLQFYELEVGYTPLYYATRTNILHFMKTLYFTLKFSGKMPELKGVASIFIGKTMN